MKKSCRFLSVAIALVVRQFRQQFELQAPATQDLRINWSKTVVDRIDTLRCRLFVNPQVLRGSTMPMEPSPR